jgi:hypothetical protein
MKLNFVHGILVGFFLKENLNKLNFKKEKKENKEQKEQKEQNGIKNPVKFIEFVAKITDQDLFNYYFPDIPNVQKTQPSWTYLPEKGVIKGAIDERLVKYINRKLNLNEIFESTIEDFYKLNNFFVNIDLKLFNLFSEVYFYITYDLNEKEYINVYSKDQKIMNTHFQYKNSKTIDLILGIAKYKENDIVICEYITNYIKKFLNNDHPITPEKVLLNHDNIESCLEDVVLDIVISNKLIKTYNFNEEIF